MRSPTESALSWPRFARRETPCEPAGLSRTDEALFERTCRDDDHIAFGELVARYRVRVNALVGRMLTATQSGIDPEDIAQETFLDAYRRRKTFRAGARFRPWLFGIAVNRCLDRIRTHERVHELALLPDSDEPSPDTAAGSPDPLSALMQSERIADIERAIGLLPPKLRAVLVLRYVDDMPYEEIAIACALPVGTVKTHLFRARAEMKRRMTGEE